jgi:hypothetical protein
MRASALCAGAQRVEMRTLIRHLDTCEEPRLVCDASPLTAGFMACAHGTGHRPETERHVLVVSTDIR